jgi:glutathione S-transferase
MSAGRVLALQRVLTSPDALRALLPKPLRRAPLLALALGRAGVARTMRKYGSHARARDEHERELCEVLDILRADLAASPSTEQPKTLLSEFSFADIAMAQVIAVLEVPTIGLRMASASRAAFADPELASRYRDLVVWRDALYARYRTSNS